jgi:DNA repair exonuclease SbcCD ATPase subunit
MLKKLESDLDSYEYETNVYNAHYEKCDEAEAALPIALKELDEFISQFTDKGSGKEYAEALFYASVGYAKDEEDAKNNEIKAAEIREQIATLERRISHLTSRYPTESTDPIAEIDRKLTEYKTLARLLSARRDKIRKFAKENPQVEKGSSLIPDCDLSRNFDSDALDIQNRLIAAERERARLISEYDRLMLDIEKIDEHEERLRELRESADAKRTSFTVIKKTMDILGNAKEKLTARYLDKVRCGFNKYVSVMDIGNEFSIDTEFNVTRIDLGKSRAPEAYSRGTRDLFALAMRLALIDALFEDAKPPVILDDPFSALDDQRLKTAIETVQRISRDRQIFYFTCTTSRQI